MKKLFLYLSAFFFFYSCDNIIEENIPANVFDVFWRTMDENYIFFKEKGVDWDSIYNVYAPKARAIRNDKELFDVFGSILPLFQDGHLIIENETNLIFSFSREYRIPISHDVDKLIATGFEIKHSEGTLLVLENREKRTAYFKINSFRHDNAPMNQLKFFLRSLDFSNGLIIDLSDNVGGSLLNVQNFVSAFFTGRKVIHHMQGKTGRGRNDFGDKIPVSIQGKGYVPDNVPVIILTSNATYSAGNVVVYILTDLRNCTVIGRATSGGGGSPRTVLLPNGWLFTLPTIKVFSPSGRNTEFMFEADIHVETEATWEFRDAMHAAVLEYLESLQR